MKVFHYDSQQMEKSHHALRIKGSHVKSVMNVTLDGTSPEEIAGIRNKHDLLLLGGDSSRNANASIRSNLRSSGQKNERGLGDALCRLRSRRGMVSNGTAFTTTVRLASSSGLNFMPSTEGDTSSDVTHFDERQIGQLGEAEHRGRIMSFMY